MDINCDLGEWESPQRTAALMRRISSANIACGGHAGSVDTMERCIQLAIRYDVFVGAHPGLPGEKGRGDAALEKEEFVHLLVSQVSVLTLLAERAGTALSHIKLHGALYHWSEHPSHAREYVAAVKRYFPKVRLFALPGGAVWKEGNRQGVIVWREIYADRGYLASGALIPRGTKGAVFSDIRLVAARATRYAATGGIEAVDGSTLSIQAETICIHSDSENSVAMAKSVAASFGVTPAGIRNASDRSGTISRPR